MSLLRNHGQILMTHQTGLLEWAGGFLGSMLRGAVMVAAPSGSILLEPVHGEQAWGLMFLALGALQVCVAGGRYAEPRAWVATGTMLALGIRLAVIGYLGPLTLDHLVFFGSPLLVQGFIAWRAWHDMDVAALPGFQDRRHHWTHG